MDAMAILRAKRKDCKGVRWSENFSRLAHCGERCADVGSGPRQAPRVGLERAPSD